MSIVFVLVPLALGLAIAAVVAFIWAVRGGQFDDMDTPAIRMLHDDDEIEELATGRHSSDESERSEETPAANHQPPVGQSHDRTSSNAP